MAINFKKFILEGVVKKASKKTPAKKKPAAKKAPVKKVPVKKTPVKRAAAKKAPVKKVPVKKTPVKRAAAKKTTVKRTPVKKAPAKKRTPIPRYPSGKKIEYRGISHEMKRGDIKKALTKLEKIKPLVGNRFRRDVFVLDGINYIIRALKGKTPDVVDAANQMAALIVHMKISAKEANSESQAKLASELHDVQLILNFLKEREPVLNYKPGVYDRMVSVPASRSVSNREPFKTRAEKRDFEANHVKNEYHGIVNKSNFKSVANWFKKNYNIKITPKDEGFNSRLSFNAPMQNRTKKLSPNALRHIVMNDKILVFSHWNGTKPTSYKFYDTISYENFPVKSNMKHPKPKFKV